MRVINQDISKTISRIKQLKGMEVKLKVNRGRNRIEEIEGILESVYPSIFTVRNNDGDVSSFSYSDILAKNIMFYGDKDKTKLLKI
ncbi:MAG: Veg family protein [Bacillota bacterium]|jgi:uncharacterized protein Veg|nr:Veg family protein [Bacillota bacterium]